MDINLTSTWIPMSLLAVLSLYMYVLFRRERREAMAFSAGGGEAHDAHGHGTPAAADHGHSNHGHGDHGHAAPAADHGHSNHAPATPAHHEPLAAAPVGKKRRLIWRTARLWLPIVAGFGAQAYLDFGGHAYYQETIKPMLEKTTAG